MDTGIALPTSATHNSGVSESWHPYALAGGPRHRGLRATSDFPRLRYNLLVSSHTVGRQARFTSGPTARNLCDLVNNLIAQPGSWHSYLYTRAPVRHTGLLCLLTS